MTEGSAIAPLPLFAGPLKPKLFLAAGVIALTAIIALSVTNLQETPYRVLFANLSDRDGGAIMASLTKQNIPYRFAAGGEVIMVPTDQVHSARLQLASSGLPRGGNVGFELMDKQTFGVTQFQERLNYQRGLQGELARSIESLAAIETARVHLAIPAGGGFLRAQQRPSASVIISTYPGRFLDRSQTAGIVHLVAASLPQLRPADVSVIDQEGSLLSQAGKEGESNSSEQLSYARRVESSLSQRIIELIEPLVGRQNVRAKVSADIDFTQTNSTDELYKPNQTLNAAAVRSRQSRANGDAAAAGAGGLVGALANQPGAGAAAPVNGPAQNVQAADANGANGANGSSSESTVNYEVDKTIRVTRNSPGAIRRITAAIIVNHKRSVDDAGAVTYTPLAAEELENLNALVREAIGFNAGRGDSISIMNSPFIETPESPVVDVPIWKDPQVLSIAIDLAKHLGIALLGLITIFKVIKPAMKSVNEPRVLEVAKEDSDGNDKSTLVNEVVADEIALPSPEEQATLLQNEKSEQVMQLARENPTAVAHIVRGWVGVDS